MSNSSHKPTVIVDNVHVKYKVTLGTGVGSAAGALRSLVSGKSPGQVIKQVHAVKGVSLVAYEGDTIGLVIETHCNYFAPLAFPQLVQAGIRVASIGSSSVRYEIGLFAQGEDLCAAKGHFIHVYVNRDTRRPVPLPTALKQFLETLT